MANKVAGILQHPVLWEELSDAGLQEVSDPRLGLDQAARRTAESYMAATNSH